MSRSQRKRRRIGLFSTIPVEVVLAAGCIPVDLNNQFITGSDPAHLLRLADLAGMPSNLCAWTRGLYGAVASGDVTEVIVVPSGDCTNNVTMSEFLERVGVTVHSFHFPLSHVQRKERLADEMERLARTLGTTVAAAEEKFQELKEVRSLLGRVDRLNWREERISGAAARLAFLQATDFDGNVELYRRRLLRTVDGARDAGTWSGHRLALFGIPTIVGNLVETLEEMGALVVLCETEHAFAMLPPADNLLEQYLEYPYPYGIEARLKHFKAMLQERAVDGVIINNQAFCHHNLELARVEKDLGDWPLLTIEADTPQNVSPRDQIRLEAFISQVSRYPKQGPVAMIEHQAEVGGQSEICPADAQSTAFQIGLDLGSRFAKIMLRDGALEYSHRMDTMQFYRRHAVREDGSLQVDLKGIYAQCGCDEPEASREKQVVATGYGRHLVQFDNARSVPELVAHAAGAAGQVTESSFVLIDLGGQDSKVILVEDATVRHFVMNDKCAAGSGRYVENMARLLMLDLDDVIHHTRSPVLLTNVCATFGESEVVGMVVEGRPIEQISAGIMASVANRTAALVARLPELKGKPVYLAGGLACSKALVVFLSDLLDVSVHSLPEPTFNGAIGCVCLCGS